jgi:hypothetical protein
MAKTPKNDGKNWTPTENRELKKLIGKNTPTRVNGFQARPDAGSGSGPRERPRVEHEARQPAAKQGPEAINAETPRTATVRSRGAF